VRADTSVRATLSVMVQGEGVTGMASSWCAVGWLSVGSKAMDDGDGVSAGVMCVAAPLWPPQLLCRAQLLCRRPFLSRMGVMGPCGCAPDVLALRNRSQSGEGGNVGTINREEGCREVLVGMACVVVSMIPVARAVGLGIRCSLSQSQLWLVPVADGISPHPGQRMVPIPGRA
jgi:hypothetical protein